MVLQDDRLDLRVTGHTHFQIRRRGESRRVLELTATGVTSAVAAPVLPLLLGKLDRRAVLGGLMVLLAVAAFVAAVTSAFVVLMVARVLPSFDSPAPINRGEPSVRTVPAGSRVFASQRVTVPWSSKRW